MTYAPTRSTTVGASACQGDAMAVPDRVAPKSFLLTDTTTRGEVWARIRELNQGFCRRYGRSHPDYPLWHYEINALMDYLERMP